MITYHAFGLDYNLIAIGILAIYKFTSLKVPTEITMFSKAEKFAFYSSKL